MINIRGYNDSICEPKIMNVYCEEGSDLRALMDRWKINEPQGNGSGKVGIWRLGIVF